MTTKNLSLGKLRGLSQCANEQFVFNILALDHRSVLRKAFSDLPDPYAESVTFKRAIVKSLSPYSTAFLLDNSIGAGPSIVSNSLPGKVGFILTVEASGYAGESHNRVSRLNDDWGCEQIKRMGATAVKLLVYYHPKAEQAPAMKDLVSQVSEECERLDIPLFLEVLTYSKDPENSKLSPEEKTEVVIQAAADLSPIGGDIYKAEFPLDVRAQMDHKLWIDACESLTQASAIPWVLLSAGVDFPVFAEQTEIACKAGASGILAGRAIWKEALEVSQQERESFLQTTGRDRMLKLGEIVNKYAVPYTKLYTSEELPEDWYTNYPGFSG